VSGDVLLDKSTIVAPRRSPLPELIANEGELFLPLIAMGELHAGARRASRAVENRAAARDPACGGRGTGADRVDRRASCFGKRASNRSHLIPF